MVKTPQAESLRRSFSSFMRLGNQLVRSQCACGPITVQQYYSLEAVVDGPRSMKDVASRVGVHQSTMTRIVAKLHKQQLVTRIRKADNQRSVEVEITDSGRNLCLAMREGSIGLFSTLLDHIPEARRSSVVDALEVLTDLFRPENEVFQEIHRQCCDGAFDCCCRVEEGDEA